METKITNELYEGYNAFIKNEVIGIKDAVCASRMALVQGYHRLGVAILEENHNFDRAKIYGQKIVSRVTESLNEHLEVKISERTVERCVQFAKKYSDFDKVPGGPNITWNKIVNIYLSNKTETKVIEQIIEDLIDCPKCKGSGKVKKPKEKNKLDTPEKKLVFSQTNEIFSLFEKSVNPTIDYGHTGNRLAVSYLIKKFGYEPTTRLVKYAISVQGKDFAPTITTPYKLKLKLGELKIYSDKQNKKKGLIL